MKALWVHSTRFLEKDGRFFSEGTMSHAIWQRYLRHFSSLIVAGRGPEADTNLHKKYVQQSSGPGVHFELLPSLNSGLDLLKNTKNVSARLEQLIRDVDGVIARLPSEHGLTAIELAHALKKPYAIELVGCAWDSMWNHGDIRGKLYAPLLTWRVRRATKRAPYVLYVTREFLQRRYPTKNTTSHASNVEIPWSRTAAISDIELSTPKIIPRNELAASRHDGSPFVLGLIGTFQTAYKGHEVALRALERVIQENENVRLRLIGTGDPARWQQKARDFGVEKFVTFEGVLLAGHPVFDWLQSLDLYLQPSLTEGLPRALLEAMACARPALASTTGGIPELLERDCLHQPGDWKSLAEKILRAMRDSQWCVQQGHRNAIEARNYESSTLDAKRTAFWSSFSTLCSQGPTHNTLN